MHFRDCWRNWSDRKRVDTPSYSAHSFNLPFLSMIDTVGPSLSPGILRPSHAQTGKTSIFFFPIFFFLLHVLVGLTGCFNWPQIQRGDSPTLNEFSHSCHFMPARENIGFGVWSTSYSDTSVKPLAHREFGQDIGINPQILWKML